MPILARDKARGKRRIMQVVESVLLDRGFTKRGGGEFILVAEDGTQWRLLFNAPTFAPCYRVWPSILRDGVPPLLGPDSEAYEAPITPSGVRYNFRFHLADETHNRCADNLVRWLHEVALPWFRSSPTVPWHNPHLATPNT